MSLSRFAGIFRAVDFAYGLADGLPGPLTIVTAPTATGAGSLTLAYGYILLTDGTIVNVLNANAAVVVGAGTDTETVTPSSVSAPTPTVPNTSLLTATFSNLHGAGEPVTSGTVGLQEAINYAFAKGGGVVSVDYAWTMFGGTTAMITTAIATLPAGVAIQDNRTGQGGLYYVSAALTNTQTKALFSAPPTIFPAPGAGNLATLDYLVLENHFVTAAFANGGVLQASYDTGVTIPASATIAATFLTAPAADQVVLLAGALGTNLASAVVNKKIILTNATADWITGAGFVRYRAAVRVHTGL